MNRRRFLQLFAAAPAALAALSQPSRSEDKFESFEGPYVRWIDGKGDVHTYVFEYTLESGSWKPLG